MNYPSSLDNEMIDGRPIGEALFEKLTHRPSGALPVDRTHTVHRSDSGY